MTAQQAAEQIRTVLRQDPPTVPYNWDADADALGRTPGEQLGEFLAKVDFIEEALVDQDRSGAYVEDLVASAHHALEMFWRLLARRNGQKYVDMIFQRHEDGMKGQASE